ncbi:hypothetical protein [uncultured Rothia sp.]|uniref:hypothetical protein n=1 Tax=uncultured Rothia sp. TaxID=316088 RepID=UPI0028DB1A01|nr:hypothetical protein [uncultured Rothia sp.]
MEALDYPRIDATVETDGIINLTIQDHNPRTFQDTTTDNALAHVWDHCARLAQTLGRDVKIYVQEGTKTSYYTLTPEGEPTLQTVTEEVEKPSIWRRKAILIPAAALLALGLGGGAFAVVNALNHPATTTATTPTGVTITLDNGTYTTGALSGDGQRISYIDGSTLYVVDATKGTLVSQTDLTKNKIEAAGLTIHPTGDGFLYTAPGSYFMWSGGKFSNINTITTKAQTIITRAGESVIISRNDPTPGSVQKISVNGTERYRSPAEGAAFIATSKGNGIWASTRGNGTIITATANGAETGAHSLATPTEGATFTRWVGATANGEIVTLWHAPNGQDILALQAPESDSVSRTIAITGAADNVKIDGTGTIAIAGDQVHYLSTEGSYALPAVPTKVTSRPAGGFSLEFGDGTTGDATPSGYITSTDTPVLGTTADGHRVTVSPDHHSIVINP